MESDALHLLFDAFRQAQVANYACATAFALLLYDIFLTQPLEITYIWRAKWSVPKVMYLFCRYYALVHLCVAVKVGTSTTNSLKLCGAYLHINAFGPQALAVVTDALIILRLRAMYYKSMKGKRSLVSPPKLTVRSVTVTLVVLFIAQMIAESVVAGFDTQNPAVHAPYPLLGAFPGCIYRDPVPHSILAIWLPALSFATLLFGMTVYKLWEFHREGSKATGLFLLFARDGSLFFAMIFCLQLFTLLTTLVAPKGRLLDMGVPWLVAVYGIVTSRLILNLREYIATRHMLESRTAKTTRIGFKHDQEDTAVDDTRLGAGTQV